MGICRVDVGGEWRRQMNMLYNLGFRVGNGRSRPSLMQEMPRNTSSGLGGGLGHTPRVPMNKCIVAQDTAGRCKTFAIQSSSKVKVMQ